jgi:hypothetical protein
MYATTATTIARFVGAEEVVGKRTSSPLTQFVNHVMYEHISFHRM